MSTALGFVVGLLQAALSLLGFVQANPNLPQAQKDTAVQVAQQAITTATNAVGNATSSSNKTILSAKQAVALVYKLPELQHPYASANESSLYCGDTDYDQDATYFYFTCSVLTSGHHVTIGRYSVNKYSGTVSPYSNAAVSNGQDVSVPSMSKYTDPDFGFSFWYPSGWQITKGPSGSEFFSDPVIRIVAPSFNSLASTDISLTEHAGPMTYAYQPVKNELSMGGVTIMSYHASSLPDWFSMSWGSPVKTLDVSGRGNMLPLLRTIISADPSVATPVSAAEQIKTIQAEKEAYAGL